MEEISDERYSIADEAIYDAFFLILKEKELDFEKIDEVCHYIPSGKNVWEGREERFDLEQLRCRRNLNNTKRLERSLGTLGGGNHFIEIDQASDGTYYLVIHSGSRNLGKQVAEYYQQLAVDLHMGKEKYFAHTLNNTVVAPPRMLIAFLENNLQADGSVKIPEALRPYMGGNAVIEPKK